MSQNMFPYDLLWKVPNELIENILMEMPDLVTLHNFVTAYPQSQDLYQRCYKKILKTVVHRLKSLQIQKLVCAVISIRNLPDLSDIEDPKRYFDSHLQYEDSPLVIDDITDSLLALQDIALITQDIEYFQKSFTYQRPYSTLSLSHKETHISHALWRLQLVCEIVRAQSRSGSHSTSLDDVGDHFILSLTDWDLEGMKCTYYRVREQYRLLTSDPPTTLALCPKVPISCPPPIIQRLLINTGDKADYTRHSEGDARSPVVDIPKLFGLTSRKQILPTKARPIMFDFVKSLALFLGRRIAYQEVDW